MDDPKWELAILATVHGFYQKLLQDFFAGEIPIPAGLDTESLADRDPGESLTQMRRWLRLLDMAITPAMMRMAFSAESDPEMAEGLLRYFAHKEEPSSLDRDKTDLIATFLYRNPRVAGQWESRGFALDGVLPVPPFEIALLEILTDTEVAPLSEDDVQVLRELDALRERAEGILDFDALIDTGIIEKARQLKRRLGPAFYHPGALAILAPYNAAFGHKFDTLFRAAANHLKRVAESIEQQGGNIVGQVDGVDVTVDLVAGMDVSELLKTDYTTALERFRRVSLLKKSLNGPLRARRAAAAATGGPGAEKVVGARPPASGVPISARPVVPPAADPRQIVLEETKLRSVEASIRAFIRAANPRMRQMVPLRFCNLALTPAEADAYCADYLEEESFRADHARILVRIVALVARMTSELEELRRKSSTHLWTPHADSLVALLEAAKTATQNAGLILITSEQNRLADQVQALNDTLQKLNRSSHLVRRALTELEEKTAK